MISFLNTYALSILGVAALTVLTALGDVTANVTVPLIATAVGVHVGGNLASSSVTTSTPTTTTTVTPAATATTTPIPPVQ